MNSSLPMRSAPRAAAGPLLLCALLAAAPDRAGAWTLPSSFPTPVSTGTIGLCTTCPDGSPAPFGACNLCGVALAPQFQCNHDPTSHAVPLKLKGTAHREMLRATARELGDGTETLDYGVGSELYGVMSSITFIAEGPIDYTYEVPFTLYFDLPGCITPGHAVRLSNVRIEWGAAPTLTATQALQFATSLYFWADFPGDGLDDFAFGLKQYRDHLDWYGLFPTLPGVASVRVPSEGVHTADSGLLADFTYGFGSGTLAGPPAVTADPFVTTGGWVRGSGTEFGFGDNVIQFRSDPGVFAPAWAASLDQFGLAAYVLQYIPTPQTELASLFLRLVDLGFSLRTGAGLNIERLDNMLIHRVQVGVSAEAPGLTEGATQVTLRVPISWEGLADSYFSYPVSMWVTFDGPGIDPQNIISIDSGTRDLVASNGGVCTQNLLTGDRTCTPGSSLDERFYGSDVLEFTVSVPEGIDRGPVVQANSDTDTLPDDADNCPAVANEDQTNSDTDAMGDACDPDDDNDGIEDGHDDCPLARNPPEVDTDGDGVADVQSDVDGDGVGDTCDPDADGDGIANGADVCPLASDPTQEDTDADLVGDACDPDIDDDRVPNVSDLCPYAFDPRQRDNDLDGAGDACDPDDDQDGVLDVRDVCIFVADPGQEDLDGDRIGDACDTDDDGDSVDDADDNCPRKWNRDQDDNDGDGPGDACDPDDDNDSAVDAADNCPFLANPDQLDLDDDGKGDACDGDLDGDGMPNEDDNCPTAPNGTQLDTDGDGEGDACDPDDDGDGVADGVDNCPLQVNPEQHDHEGDGQGDVCDPDDDNDGVGDLEDNCAFVPNADQLDTDGDRLGNACDADDDGDGVPDGADACPLAWTDADADGNGCTDLVADLPALVQRLGMTSGIARSLAAKASAAAKASPATASNVLDAFLAEVAAQRGKHVGDAEADLLVRFVAFARLSL